MFNIATQEHLITHYSLGASLSTHLKHCMRHYTTIFIDTGMHTQKCTGVFP